MKFRRIARLAFSFFVVTTPIAAFFVAYVPEARTHTVKAMTVVESQDEYALRHSMQFTSTATSTPTSTHTPTPTTTSTTSSTPTDTPTPSLTPSRTPDSTAIYVDQYEPNNSIQEAYSTSAGIVLPSNTLWPSGDVDYFRFHAKAGSAYEVLTRDLTAGIDTVLTVYDSNGNEIGSNDDATALSRASLVTFSADVSGFYYASVVNVNPTDPANQTYSFEVKEILGTSTPTPIASGTPVPSVDNCEPNNSFDEACLLLLGTTYNLDFVLPYVGDGRDNDFFRVWIKQGLYYTCETFDLSSVNDTNMIIYSGAGEEHGLAGNDDKNRAAGDLGSQVNYQAAYTGWLYVLVGPGPGQEPDYESQHLYTYSLECTQVEATATPTPTNTLPPAPTVPKGGGNQVPTPTPFTFPPTPTPFEFPTAPSPTSPPVVEIVPLPTPTLATAPQQDITVDVTVYYDANRNTMPELTEGVMDVAVALYDNASGQLLSFGYTNEGGNVRFGPIAATGPIRVSVPFLNFSQVVSESTTIQLRIEPRPLPGGIP